MRKAIENFLDDFMHVERQSGILREHYRRIFQDLIPKYFVPKRDDDGGVNVVNEDTTPPRRSQSQTSDKNIPSESQ